MDSDVKTCAYKYYVTDALKILTSNTGQIVGGMELTSTFREIVNADYIKEQQEKQEKTAQDVIENMKSKIASWGGKP